MSKIIDEIGNKDLLKQLEALGLSEKEAVVYLALLPRQDTGSSKLIQATGLHGQFVYDALAKLEDLGLAKHVIQNGRKKFSANTPSRLMSLVEEKRLTAAAIAKELQSRFAGKHEQSFEVYQGASAFIAHQIELLKRTAEGSTLDVIASESERYLATLIDYGMREEYEKVRVERKIRVRYLGAPSQRDRLKQREGEQKLWEYRILPGGATGLMNTDIHPTHINFNVFGDPILSFTLTSKEVAEGYKAFFEAVWQLSSK